MTVMLRLWFPSQRYLIYIYANISKSEEKKKKSKSLLVQALHTSLKYVLLFYFPMLHYLPSYAYSFML